MSPGLAPGPGPRQFPPVADTLPFWKTKTLDAMTRAEWESLCDGCGRCCLHKLRDEDTNEVAFTKVACRLLNIPTCRCADYANRRKWVPDCVKLTPAKLKKIDWLPPTCAYRLLAEGKELMWWHPLVSGDPETVHKAGVSVRGRALRERDAGPLEEHVVRWPGQVPRRAAAAPSVRAVDAAAPPGDEHPVSGAKERS